MKSQPEPPDPDEYAVHLGCLACLLSAALVIAMGVALVWWLA